MNNIQETNIRQIISDKSIHTIRVCSLDNANIQIARFVSSRHFLDKVMSRSLAYPSVLFATDSSGEIVPSIGGGYEEGYPSWLLKPDLATFNIIPYSPGTARVIADLYNNKLEPIKTNPRHVLRNVLNEYEELNIKVKGAFEYEFFIFKKNEGKLEPIWSGLNYVGDQAI